jgi:hypothetical protein
MEEVMSLRMEEIGPKLGLTHEFYSITPIEN